LVTSALPPKAESFRHEALLYSGEAGFVEGTLPFIREGLAAAEPVMVLVAASKIRLLRDHLGDQAESVRWTDMAGIGGNPARIIPLWRQFASRHGGQGPIRGIGEPIWPERSPAELVESHHHEALLNVAFADASGLRILCPYDVDALAPAVIDEAGRNHPLLVTGSGPHESAEYRGVEEIAINVPEPFPEPPADASALPLDEGGPAMVRSLVSIHASRVRISEAQTEDLLLALMALVDGLRDDAGQSILRTWLEADAVVCELRSTRRIDDPLAGRELPPITKSDHRALWVANQLCDLVQLRRSTSGTVVRLRVAA
jgi:hypothetical protein